VSGPASQVASLVRATLAAEARLGETRLVCVDGPAASGKTTLAAAVEAALRRRECQPTTVHMDDLYDGWAGLRPELESRLIAQVLQPLGRGEAARWQRYDWYEQRFSEWHDLEVPDVLVLEGCGSGAQAYAPYRSLLVWLEAPLEVRLRRWVDRDGADVIAHRQQWMEAEDTHFARNATREHADIRLSSR
jgi:uridine kinase